MVNTQTDTQTDSLWPVISQRAHYSDCVHAMRNSAVQKTTNCDKLLCDAICHWQRHVYLRYCRSKVTVNVKEWPTSVHSSAENISSRRLVGVSQRERNNESRRRGNWTQVGVRTDVLHTYSAGACSLLCRTLPVYDGVPTRIPCSGRWSLWVTWHIKNSNYIVRRPG